MTASRYPPHQRQIKINDLAMPLLAPINVPASRRCRKCEKMITIDYKNLTNDIIICRNCGARHRIYLEVVLCSAPSQAAESDI